MPGEKELLREFVEREFPAAERAVCLRLLEAIFDKMQLAGEAGSLLKIEEEIRSAIEDARDAWQKLATQPPELFTTTELNQISTAPELTGLERAVSSLTPDARHLTTDFWERIEERIYAALRDYAEQAENGGGFQRRLFAEDAARGFAFIDVCRKRYDVALMNPPFGRMPSRVSDYLAKEFPTTYYDVYSSFVERGFLKLTQGGRLGGITSKTFFAGSRMREFRHWLMNDAGLEQCADLGMGVLDNATVETACYVMSSTNPTPFVQFYDLLKSDSRADALLEAAKGRGEGRYSVTRKTITEFPNCSFSAYWGSTSLLSIFKRFPALDPDFAETAAGQMTGDDFRFVRSRWEIAHEASRRWHTFAKGGDFFRYFCDWHLLIEWTDAALEEYRKQTVRSVLLSRRSGEFVDRKALVWNRVNEIGFNVRALPVNSKFSDKAPAVFPKSDPLVLLGLLCSRMADRLCALQNPNRMFEVRDVSVIPIPSFDTSRAKEIVLEIIEIKQRWSSFAEPSSIFRFPPKPIDHVSLFSVSCGGIQRVLDIDRTRLLELQSEIDALVEAGYQVSAEDLALFANVLGDVPAETVHEESVAMAEDRFWFIQVVQYGLGVAFGRWDIRYATGEQAAPELPDPFAPLPVCPPGQLQNAQGLPARPEDVPAAYPVRIPWDGILVDDPNHPLDIERRVREVIEIIWSGHEGGPTAEAIEHEACEILGVKSLRDYFRKPAGFFADHLKRYSKSRRQAPIYWPLSTASGSYTLWIYYHRLTDDTLYAAVSQFVEPRIEEAKQTHARLHEKGDARNKPEDKTYEETTRFIGELATFREELLRIAGFWKPNLNDGVLITAAPLWSLFALKPWQKKLKETWQALEKGDYDWAHLAYSIWPERVTKACEKDRSIAIAHGLEHLCKVEPPKAKKKAKSKAAAVEVEVDPELIGED